MQLKTQLAWQHFGTSLKLRSLDRGLRESVSVQKEQLKAHAEIAKCSNDILAANRALAELTKEATAIQRQQLQAQVQQLQLQQQRNEAELRKEERLAQENTILRLYVDLYSKAQSLKQQGLFFDCVIVTLGAFRVYQQVYSDLDDANNRLKVTELKDRLYGELRDAVSREDAQQVLAAAYAEVLREPAALAHDLRTLDRRVAAVRGELGDIRALQTAEALPRSPSMAAELDALKRSAADLVTRFEGVTLEVPADELFLPSTPERLGGVLGGFGTSWNAWCERASQVHGLNIVELRTEFLDFPTTTRGKAQEIESLAGEMALVRDVFSMLASAEALGSALPDLRDVARQLRSRLADVPGQPGTDAAAIGAGSIALADLQRGADAVFGTFRAALSRNKHANSPKFSAAAQRRAADSRVLTAGNLRFVQESFELDSAIAALMSDLAATAKRYQKAVATLAADPGTFGVLEAGLRSALTGEQLQRVDTRIAEYRPGCIGMRQNKNIVTAIQ